MGSFLQNKREGDASCAHKLTRANYWRKVTTWRTLLLLNDASQYKSYIHQSFLSVSIQHTWALEFCMFESKSLTDSFQKFPSYTWALFWRSDDCWHQKRSDIDFPEPETTLRLRVVLFASVPVPFRYLWIVGFLPLSIHDSAVSIVASVRRPLRCSIYHIRVTN